MKVYAIHEGSIYGPHEVMDVYLFLEEAVRSITITVDLWQKEYDAICNDGDSPIGKRWKENKDPRKFVIKSWDNGINEIYITEYNVK